MVADDETELLVAFEQAGPYWTRPLNPLGLDRDLSGAVNKFLSDPLAENQWEMDLDSREALTFYGQGL